MRNWENKMNTEIYESAIVSDQAHYH